MPSTARLFLFGLLFIAVVAVAGIISQVVHTAPPVAPEPQVVSHKTSQPPAAPVIATPARSAAPQQEWTWRLAGTLILPGRREALFTRDREKRTVKEGEAIDGWTLAAVDASSVRITGPGGERTLHPVRDSAVANAAATDQEIRADQRERRRAALRTEAAMQQLTKAMMSSQ